VHRQYQHHRAAQAANRQRYPLAVALLVLARLLRSGTNRWWRLALLPMFWGAGSGCFQWRDRTGVGLAARGTRKTGETEERIEHEHELAQVRHQARQVNIKTLVTASAATLIALAMA
jgi:hypothetical protein